MFDARAAIRHVHDTIELCIMPFIVYNIAILHYVVVTSLIPHKCHSWCKHCNRGRTQMQTSEAEVGQFNDLMQKKSKTQKAHRIVRQVRVTTRKQS